MKKYILFISILGLLFAFSCDKKELGPTLEIVKAPTILPLETSNFVLTDETSGDTILVLRWEPAEYNLATEITYRVEIAKAGTNFEEPALLVRTSEDSLAMTTFTLNKFMTVDLGLPIDEESQVEIRVNAFVGSEGPASSDAVSITASTYDPPYTPATLMIMTGDTELKTLKLLDEYIDNPDVDIDEAGFYEGYVWLSADNLSVTIKGGDDMAREFGSVSSSFADQTTTHVLAEGEAPITVTEEGYYRFKLNMYNMSLEVMPTEWGVIGSGIPPYDWSTSVVMDYSIDNDIWTKVVETTNAQFKFRPNQTWEPLNYGDDGNNGIPNEYGANIPIDAGTKIITLDLSEFPYSYSVGNAQ